MNENMSSFLIPLLLLLFPIANCFKDDHIPSIPFYTGNPVNFNTFGGYLSAESGQLFYLFTESSNSPSTDPLVLWLNGGPGCSSMLGQFIELGPYHPYTNGESEDDDVNIEYNPYSWNNFANILFLESPPCVGFSYPNSLDCQSYKTNDNQTKWDNYLALQSFFSKYPHYSHRELLITGESYAGHYIPQLASLIIKQNKINKYAQINLVGIGIGNPYINRDDNWFHGWIPSMYAFGIINDEIRQNLNSGSCANVSSFDGGCSNKSWEFVDDYLSDMNVYDVDVRGNCSIRSRQETELLRYVYNANAYENNLDEANIWNYPYSACNEANLESYLNYVDVWNAFHVNVSWMDDYSNQTWSSCAWDFDGYDVNETDDAMDQVVYIRNVLANDVRVLIYSGNNDLVCSMEGSRYWIYGKLNETDTGNKKTNWTKWRVNGEVGGWYEEWEKFTFLVVRDAGHEVPEYQPVRAYSMFERFVANDYSDLPVFVRYSEWNNYGKNEDDDQRKEDVKFSVIGIGIGFCLCLIILLCIFGCVWLKNKKYESGIFELYDAKLKTEDDDYHKQMTDDEQTN